MKQLVSSEYSKRKWHYPEEVRQIASRIVNEIIEAIQSPLQPGPLTVADYIKK